MNLSTIRDYLANGIQAVGGFCNWLAGIVRPTDGGPRPTIPK